MRQRSPHPPTGHYLISLDPTQSPVLCRVFDAAIAQAERDQLARKG